MELENEPIIPMMHCFYEIQASFLSWLKLWLMYEEGEEGFEPGTTLPLSRGRNSHHESGGLFSSASEKSPARNSDAHESCERNRSFGRSIAHIQACIHMYIDTYNHTIMHAYIQSSDESYFGNLQTQSRMFRAFEIVKLPKRMFQTRTMVKLIKTQAI
jgi:hypothetical protein